MPEGAFSDAANASYRVYLFPAPGLHDDPVSPSRLLAIRPSFASYHLRDRSRLSGQCQSILNRMDSSNICALTGSREPGPEQVVPYFEWLLIEAASIKILLRFNPLCELNESMFWMI